MVLGGPYAVPAVQTWVSGVHSKLPNACTVSLPPTLCVFVSLGGDGDLRCTEVRRAYSSLYVQGLFLVVFREPFVELGSAHTQGKGLNPLLSCWPFVIGY